jgi:hypothetical protein
MKVTAQIVFGGFTLLGGLKRAFLATFKSLRRPSRRSTPTVHGLENRTLLSGQSMDKALIDSVRPLTAGQASRMPKPPKPNKNVTFVTGLYHTYFRRGPDPAELSYALEQLANGVSQSALRNDFKIVVSKTGNRVSAPRYVNALFATIGGRPPTPVSQAYWLGLANSGLSRQQLRQRFQSSNGTLPQPTLTWTNPASIVYGTPLSSDQLNATASVPGTFTYSPPAGTVLYAINDQPLSVVFTPADTADYPIVSASTTINVYAAKPTITWPRPQAIEYGTSLGDTQLNPVATWTVDGQTVNVPGTFTYSSPAGTVLPVGTNLSLTVVFRPFDSLDYRVAVFRTNITVTLGPPPPTPTPPLPTPPPTPSPTPSPTPYPTPAPTPYQNFAIISSPNQTRRVTPPPTPPPTPFGIVTASAVQTPAASFMTPMILQTAADASTDILTPPPTDS